jgi:hypothetical protein
VLTVSEVTVGLPPRPEGPVKVKVWFDELTLVIVQMPKMFDHVPVPPEIDPKTTTY